MKSEIKDKIKKIQEFRNETFIWAKQNIKDKIIVNENFNQDIYITTRGLKHTLKGKNLRNIQFYEKNLATIESLKDIVRLLENAKYVKFEKDNRNRENVSGIHLFITEYVYNQKKYTVKIIVKETNDKTFFYNHSLI